MTYVDDPLKEYLAILRNWYTEGLKIEDTEELYRFFKRYREYFPQTNGKDFYRFMQKLSPGEGSRFLSQSQFKSKRWLTEALIECGERSLGVTFILGGWYGLLGHFLLYDNRLRFNQIFSFDIDERSSQLADVLNNDGRIDHWRFKAVTKDILNLNYLNSSFLVHDKNMREIQISIAPETIINTSCEHIDLDRWWGLVPKGKRVVLQSNDMFDEPDHVSCFHTLGEFKNALKIGRICYEGETSIGRYKRFMIIGYK